MANQNPAFTRIMHRTEGLTELENQFLPRRFPIRMKVGTVAPIEVSKPPQRFYATMNRKLGRAGHPIPPRKKKETTKKVEPELGKPKVVTPEINDVEPMIESDDDDDGFSDDGFTDDDSLKYFKDKLVK